MKKLFSCLSVQMRMIKRKYIMLLIPILMANIMYAAQITEQQANTVAVNFLKSETGRTVVKATLHYKQVEPDGTVDFYIFNFLSVKAFVIVTGDDNLEPVIAYSTESDFDMQNTNYYGVSDWMIDIRKQILSALKENVKADIRVSDLWTAYKSGANIMKPMSGSVFPLLTTAWDQSMNIGGVDHYNSLCPYNNLHAQRTLTGCVATAMAQIMKYWNSPIHGTGSHSYSCTNSNSGYIYGNQSANFGATTYNWSQMPDAVTGSTNNAIDILMYHCGVAVEMDYGDATEGGSASSTVGGSPSAESAYVDYFGYRNTLGSAYKFFYTTTDWQNLLESEINAARPVHYRGDGPNGGHSWVCDGYDAFNFFHMNWGWGGSANGYFDVGNLNPNGNNFNSGQAVIVGIWPGTLSDCNPNWNLTGIEFNDNTYQASDYITSSRSSVSNLNIGYTAANNITLTQGFNTNSNANFTAKIQGCKTYRIGQNSSHENETDESKQTLAVAPNPTSDKLKLSLNAPIDRCEVFDAMGQLVLKPSTLQNEIDVSQLKPGVYLINFFSNGEKFNSRFVKM
ncbi:MAG: thiol protease/hemagglutinin PrtT [Bacteroidia bacterium]